MKTITPTKKSGRAVTMAPHGAQLEHETFCLPRPDADGLRVESYQVERYADDGTVTARPVVTRCIECGAQVVEERDVA